MSGDAPAPVRRADDIKPDQAESGDRVVRLSTGADVTVARRAVREMARQLSFGSADQTRLATAVSEIARNALQYAGGGTCRVSDASTPNERSLRVEVCDDGPGISDLARAMSDGFSTGNGLGAGMPGARRLVHHFDVDTVPGHTTVTLVLSSRNS